MSCSGIVVEKSFAIDVNSGMTWAPWFNSTILSSTAKLAVTAIEVSSSSLFLSSQARAPRAEVVDLNRLIARRPFGQKEMCK